MKVNGKEIKTIQFRHKGSMLTIELNLKNIFQQREFMPEKPAQIEFADTIEIDELMDTLIRFSEFCTYNLKWRNKKGIGIIMKLKNIFDESKELLDDGYVEQHPPGFALVDEYDENGNLITVIKHDFDNNIAVHVQDIENNRHNYEIMELKQYMKLDFGNFRRLINELFYYAQ